MGELIRSMDWKNTPLGSIDTWSASLRTMVNLALNSNFPISLAWGPEFTQIYNDGYWPICKAKHPQSMGQDFRECWASAWAAIGDAFASAAAGTTAFLEDQRVFLDRLGYMEEAFFTFSFSPIFDDDGQVAGLFHPVTETTNSMLGQRRTRSLKDFADRTVGAASLSESLTLAAKALGTAESDLPFVLFYQLDAKEQIAVLGAQTGLEAGSKANPVTIDLTDTQASWPMAAVVATGEATYVGDIAERFGTCSPDRIQNPIKLRLSSRFIPPVVSDPFVS